MEGEQEQSLWFDCPNQYEQLANYDTISKKILQRFKYVASGKTNIRLNINNFYKKQSSVSLSIPIFHPKNWTTIIENMIERNINSIHVSVTKVGQLRMKKQREKQVPVEFDSDGSIESVEDEQVKSAITVNKPSRAPYRGEAVVRCIFCHHSNKSKEGSKSAGPFYGPFQGKIFAHLMCLLWCSQVYIQNKTLDFCGVEQAVKQNKNLVCSCCKQKGASFLCHMEGCKKKAHFKCAAENNWIFKWETYQAFCPEQREDPFQENSVSNTRTTSNRRKRMQQVKSESN